MPDVKQTPITWDDVERALLVKGIDPDADGHEAAVKQFQQRNGLEPTGKPDLPTLKVLLGDVPGGHAMESQKAPSRLVPEHVREALRPVEQSVADDTESVMLDRAREEIKRQRETELDMLDLYKISSGRYFDGIPRD